MQETLVLRHEHGEYENIHSLDYHWGWIYENQAHDCLTTGASSMHFDYESSLIRPAGVFVAYTALSTLARKNRSSLQ